MPWGGMINPDQYMTVMFWSLVTLKPWVRESGIVFRHWPRLRGDPTQPALCGGRMGVTVIIVRCVAVN